MASSVNWDCDTCFAFGSPCAEHDESTVHVESPITDDAVDIAENSIRADRLVELCSLWRSRALKAETDLDELRTGRKP